MAFITGGEDALDPYLVGDMVLEAVRENAFYIFTHPETESLVEARRTDMAGAFGRWRGYRRQRGIRPRTGQQRDAVWMASERRFRASAVSSNPRMISFRKSNMMSGVSRPLNRSLVW